MIRIIVISLATILSGCTALVGYAPNFLPSLEYCDNVVYIRDGNQVNVQAKCRAPVR